MAHTRAESEHTHQDTACPRRGVISPPRGYTETRVESGDTHQDVVRTRRGVLWPSRGLTEAPGGASHPHVVRAHMQHDTARARSIVAQTRIDTRRAYIGLLYLRRRLAETRNGTAHTRAERTYTPRCFADTERICHDTHQCCAHTQMRAVPLARAHANMARSVIIPRRDGAHT